MKADLIIIGAGIAGLSTAYYAHMAGMRVIVVERANIGAGASGGIVGAMAPHMPENWNVKRQYQLEALVMAAEFWPNIDAHSHIDSGYRQYGRWQALSNARLRELAEQRTISARKYWHGIAEWRVLPDQRAPFANAIYGVAYDSLSAQIDPRAALSSLAAYLRMHNVEIIENFDAMHIAQGHVSGPVPIEAANIVITGGYDGWPFVRRYLGADFGEGVKGQAAILHYPKWHYPMITGNGYYIVAHDNGRLAVGSTSETRWSHRNNDHNLDALLTKIRDEFPELTHAEIAETWAGIRPRAYRPDPLIGALENGIFVNNGGFKTGFSFALKTAQDLVGMIEGRDVDVPDGFLPNRRF